MIKIGTPLILEIEIDGELERHRCKIVDQQDGFLFVDYPISEGTGRTSFFEIGTEFSASFIGKDDSLYCFSTILKDKKEFTIPTLLLHYPGGEGLNRIQRRHHVRVDTTVDVSFHHEAGVLKPFTSITEDISGGGLSILLLENQVMDPETIWDIWMVLPMDSGGCEYIYASAEVVRTSTSADFKKRTCSMKFLQIGDRERQIITRYCFEQQLKARRWGFS